MHFFRNIIKKLSTARIPHSFVGKHFTNILLKENKNLNLLSVYIFKY